MPCEHKNVESFQLTILINTKQQYSQLAHWMGNAQNQGTTTAPSTQIGYPAFTQKPVADVHMTSLKSKVGLVLPPGFAVSYNQP